MRNLLSHPHRPRRAGWSRHLLGCLVLAVAVLSAGAAHAQSKELGLELAPMVGFEFFGPTENLENGPYMGLRAGFNIDETFGTELSLGLVPTMMIEDVVPSPEADWAELNPVTVLNIEGFAIIHLAEKTEFIPYVQAGLGLKVAFEPDFNTPPGGDPEGSVDLDPMIGYGGGVKYWPMEWLAVRLDIRHLLAFDRPPYKTFEIKDEEDSFSPDNAFNNLVISLGVGFQIGGWAGDDDEDGVADDVDQCLDEQEDKDDFQDQDGCPDPDNDNDGFADAADKCPNQAEDKDGFQDEDGCPELDNDGDGFPDDKDADPNQPETINGYLDDDGAPDVIPENLKQFVGAVQGIAFALGSDRLAPPSLPILKQAATVLKELPNLKVTIEGHTDARGDRQLNIDLSQKRADSVKTFLVQQGIAAERLTAVGYGPDKPVDPAQTEEAWAKNRRVEFKLGQ